MKLDELEMLKRQQKEIKKQIAELEKRKKGLVCIQTYRDGSAYFLTILATKQPEYRPSRYVTVCQSDDLQHLKNRICALVKELQKCYQELESEDSVERVRR